MTRIASRIACAAVVGLSFACVAYAQDTPPAGSIDVLFSPHGGCTDRIVSEIAEAQSTVQVQAYSFTSAPIAKAILEAQKRGVQCKVILDASQKTAQYSELDFFFNQGVPVYVDGEHAIAHNKIILIDGRAVITGSFNFTAAAEERNAENMLIISGFPDVATKYSKNFARHLSHSTRYEGRTTQPESPRAPSVPPVPPSVERDSAPEKPAADPMVYVTRTGEKYHSDGCSYLRQSSIPMKLSEAKAQGYTPCSRCRPPQ